MKVVLAVLAFIAMFGIFIAADHKERKLYTISYITTVVGMVALVVLEFIKLWTQ